MSLSVSGYPQPYAHSLHHNPHHYHQHQHSMQNGGMSTPPNATASHQHDFYSYNHQMPRYPDHHDHATVAAVAASGYFPNWMLGPPPEVAMGGHIPDGYHSFGAPGSNSPGGTQYQSFIQYENGVPIRCIKRRVTANKKERRRTLSINNAFAQLRGCIPNVPSDTKLSKIKTLRLATSYISYLMDILAKDDPELSKSGFKAEITKKTPSSACSMALSAVVDSRSEKCEKDESISEGNAQRTLIEIKEEKRKRESDGESETSSQGSSPCPDKKSKGRTGWPQHVWAAELK